eukprot:12662-Heterococcus_DN1.PRE.1
MSRQILCTAPCCVQYILHNFYALQTLSLSGLGLAVIDEEQRFGVQQRNTLTEGQHTMQQQQQQQQQQQHDNDNVNSDETAASTVDFCESQYHQSTDKRDCHVLYMSATPIPRSLGLTVFGNIDVVRLNQKPPNSEQVQTTVVSTDKLMDCFVALKHNADAVFNTMFILQVVKRVQTIADQPAGNAKIFW